ncbi:MAG: UDP-3-O-acyl-N-acetylglucosamine deacetylase [Thalassobaculaceae bacterium]
MTFQTTLRQPITCDGTGVHSGRKVTLTLHPAAVDHGVVFRRVDIAGRDNLVAARWDSVTDTRMCTVLENAAGVKVSTVEHLMAALAGCGIDNVLVDIDGEELPIMDGSARQFVDLITGAGAKKLAALRRVLHIDREVSVREKDKFISIAPHDVLSIDCSLDFDHSARASGQRVIELVNGNFNELVASARTFGFQHEVEYLRANGLARGGSLDNAVVLKGDIVLNPEGLRFDDEPVRHKILDCIGDLFLAGGHVCGLVRTERGGHEMNNRLLKAIFADPKNWHWADQTRPTRKPVAATAAA